MHMLVSMYYCIYMFSYGPYGPEIKHYYIIIIRNRFLKFARTAYSYCFRKHRTLIDGKAFVEIVRHS